MKIKSLERKGKHWKIPIVGESVTGVYIGDYFRLNFEESKWIDIEGDFKLLTRGQESLIQKISLNDARKLIDLLHMKVTDSTACYSGELLLEFNNGMEIVVEDGPFENWHFYDNLRTAVHGGIGKLTEGE